MQILYFVFYFRRITVWWKLRNIDPFSAKKFPAKAQQLFIDANNAQQRQGIVMHYTVGSHGLLMGSKDLTVLGKTYFNTVDPLPNTIMT